MNQQRIARILRRWDAIAQDQLQEHAQRLDEENAELRREASWAWQDAEQWRDIAQQAMEDNGGHLGITQDGRILTVPA